MCADTRFTGWTQGYGHIRAKLGKWGSVVQLSGYPSIQKTAFLDLGTQPATNMKWADGDDDDDNDFKP
eukprot:1150462-Pelagomonas_calceolata.AAC.2